jgi:hypothetical protein
VQFSLCVATYAVGYAQGCAEVGQALGTALEAVNGADVRVGEAMECICRCIACSSSASSQLGHVTNHAIESLLLCFLAMEEI